MAEYCIPEPSVIERHGNGLNACTGEVGTAIAERSTYIGGIRDRAEKIIQEAANRIAAYNKMLEDPELRQRYEEADRELSFLKTQIEGEKAAIERLQQEEARLSAELKADDGQKAGEIMQRITDVKMEELNRTKNLQENLIPYKGRVETELNRLSSYANAVKKHCDRVQQAYTAAMEEWNSLMNWLKKWDSDELANKRRKLTDGLGDAAMALVNMADEVKNGEWGVHND